MESITEQIGYIRELFKTKRIYDKTTKHKLTNEEIDGIIYIIKHNRSDGQYVINDDIIAQFKNGCVYIKDNIYE